MARTSLLGHCFSDPFFDRTSVVVFFLLVFLPLIEFYSIVRSLCGLPSGFSGYLFSVRTIRLITSEKVLGIVSASLFPPSLGIGSHDNLASDLEPNVYGHIGISSRV